MSNTTTYGYDSQGNLTSIETPLTWTTGQAFDALNRLATITDPYTHTTVTSYDAHDRPLTVQDPNGHTTSYVYDGFGDAIQRTSPDSQTTVYYYDADGNLSSKTDADSHTTYDALDRPLVTTVTGDSTLTVTNTYDQTGHGDGIGRLTSVTDHAGSLSLSYDERGNVLTNARTIFGTTYTTTYAYDGASRISSIVYPSAGTTGWTVGYTRSISGYVTGITATPPGGSPSTIASSIVFYPFGPLSSLTWGNGVTGSDSRDQDYRLTHLTDTAASAIVNLTYGNDADSNLHTVSDALNAANSQTLTYDELERLTGAVSGTGGYGTLSYIYDNNGNRKTDTGTSYTYLSTGNVLTKVGTTTYLHTSTGNIKGGFLGIGAE